MDIFFSLNVDLLSLSQYTKKWKIEATIIVKNINHHLFQQCYTFENKYKDDMKTEIMIKRVDKTFTTFTWTTWPDETIYRGFTGQRKEKIEAVFTGSSSTQ